MRNLAKSAEESRSSTWITYTPYGKSAIVLGGVGTLKLPPDDYNRRLATLSRCHNASTGIPVLIYPEVWDCYNLHEGDVIAVCAMWKKMTTGWVERFPSIKGIPKGYLVLTDIRQVSDVWCRNQPTEFHPFTVMEYSKDNAILYDFVYASADTRVDNYRMKLSRFFAQYKHKNGRYGRYLLTSDVNHPFLEADYPSPAVLRQNEPGADSHLALIRARVREMSFNNQSIESILKYLTFHYDKETLRGRLSSYIGLPRSWFRGGSDADAASQFLIKCIEMKKVEELLDALTIDKPDQILSGG
ncbi:MAG: hypothetical protein P1S60_03240 [Anaerolineae bacterium]|nr:hypothetical protein [Anaerolineae bacterium]